MMTPAMVCWPASRTSAAAPASAPHTVHGCRRPNRLVVRSDSAPATGLEIIATAAPMPVTQPSTATLWAGPAIACTWLGSSTVIGPKYPRYSPRLASAMSAIQRFPTRRAGSAARASALLALPARPASPALLTGGTSVMTPPSGRGLTSSRR